MKELTARQKAVHFFISQYIRTYSYSPAVRDVSRHFRITVKAAYDHITALKKKGFLRQLPGCPRTLEILHPVAGEVAGEALGKDAEFVSVPLLGNVAAGVPLLAEEDHDGGIPVHKSMLKKMQSYFALNVKGDSMSGAGIIDGDIAIIEKQNTANNGEIVVAVVDGAVTLKRFYMENDSVKLAAENPSYESIYCSDAKILGRLTCLIRSY